jgi:hypothetical protein
LTTNFRRAPSPARAPRYTDAFPIAPRSGRAASKSSSSPEAKKMSFPCSAGALLPETGASRKAAPVARTAAATAAAVAASTVEAST